MLRFERRHAVALRLRAGRVRRRRRDVRAPLSGRAAHAGCTSCRPASTPSTSRPAAGTPARPAHLVFTGSMDWLPNEDAMMYFVRDILPLIRAGGAGCRPSPSSAGRRRRRCRARRRAGRRSHRPRRRRAAVHRGGQRLHRAAAHRRRHAPEDLRSDGAWARRSSRRRLAPKDLPVTDGSTCVIADEPAAFARRGGPADPRHRPPRRSRSGRPRSWWSSGTTGRPSLAELEDALARVKRRTTGAARSAACPARRQLSTVPDGDVTMKFPCSVWGTSAVCRRRRSPPTVTTVDRRRRQSRQGGRLNDGRSPIVEPGLDELLRDDAANGRLRATTNTEEAIDATDVSLICVGTPSRKNGSLDLVYLERVCEQIGEALAGQERPITSSSSAARCCRGRRTAWSSRRSSARRARSTATDSACRSIRSSCARAPRSRTSASRR